jgi:hypothetical protein
MCRCSPALRPRGRRKRRMSYGARQAPRLAPIRTSDALVGPRVRGRIHDARAGDGVAEGVVDGDIRERRAGARGEECQKRKDGRGAAGGAGEEHDGRESNGRRRASRERRAHRARVGEEQRRSGGVTLASGGSEQDRLREGRAPAGMMQADDGGIAHQSASTVRQCSSQAGGGFRSNGRVSVGRFEA